MRTPDPCTLFLLYEPSQVALLEKLVQEKAPPERGALVVALSLDVEEKLRERHIEFLSARSYKQIPSDLLLLEERMIATFFSDPRWSQFVYRGVELPTTFLVMFRVYLERVRYWASLILSVVEHHPQATRLVVFAPSGVALDTAGGLAKREVQEVVDCTKIIAGARGIAVQVLPIYRPLSHSSSQLSFKLQRAVFGWLLRVWNVSMHAFRRPQAIRIAVSDYWKNIAPVVAVLPEAEYIFLDRAEIRHIDWRTLLRQRMQFIKTESYLSRGMRMHAQERAEQLVELWHQMRASVPATLVVRGCSFDELLLQAMDDIVLDLEKTLCSIEGTYAFYAQQMPDVVLLRASVSTQIHFSILPLVAKQCGIPALELQHGLEYFGPGSLTRDHAAEYIAVYGPLLKKELVSIGYAPERIQEIGSPRFDDHHLPHLSRRAPHPYTVLCVAPDIRFFETLDSYAVEEYFNAVAQALGTTVDVEVIIKLRAGPAGEALFRAIIARAFSNVPYTVAQYESLPELFAQSDAVVSCYSTVILEALQCGMPVIIPALNSIDKQVIDFHFSYYRDAGVVEIAYGQDELARLLSSLRMSSDAQIERQKKLRVFMEQNFCFDRNATRRLATLITELAHTVRPDTLKNKNGAY